MLLNALGGGQLDLNYRLPLVAVVAANSCRAGED